jgi:hypothetical protein
MRLKARTKKLETQKAGRGMQRPIWELTDADLMLFLAAQNSDAAHELRNTGTLSNETLEAIAYETGGMQ